MHPAEFLFSYLSQFFNLLQYNYSKVLDHLKYQLQQTKILSYLFGKRRSVCGNSNLQRSVLI